MDLTKAVSYRGLDLNSVSFSAGLPISGIAIDAVDYHAVEAVGYREKRSLADGLDASDVFLGGRTLRMRGSLYGLTRGDLYDHLHALRAALSPTAAYAESPSDYGYLPLNFEAPTADTINHPLGYIPQMILARPLTVPEFVIVRDHIGGESSLGVSISWSVALEAKDPRIYAQSEVSTFFDAAGTATSGSGSVVNKGAYPAPLMMLVYVPASVTFLRTLTFTAFGAEVAITLPDSTHARTARYNGVEKTLHLEESGVESLRMDLLSLSGADNHPLVPSGSSAYSWIYRNVNDTPVAVNALSRFWFWPSWV